VQYRSSVLGRYLEEHDHGEGSAAPWRIKLSSVWLLLTDLNLFCLGLCKEKKGRNSVAIYYPIPVIIPEGGHYFPSVYMYVFDVCIAQQVT
jgi:hypothetical protein